MNQAGNFRVFVSDGAGTNNIKYYRCDICRAHSKLTAGSVAKIRIDNGELSFTQANHHPNCTPLSEREIAFQEFDRQCRKLVKENGLNHIKPMRRQVF